MPRKTYVQHPVTGELIPKEDYYRPSDVDAPMVMPDIQPYQSMVDGTMIMSRSHHRAHLRQHNCIEIGNELAAHRAQAKPPTPPPGLKETLLRAYHQHMR